MAYLPSNLPIWTNWQTTHGINGAANPTPSSPTLKSPAERVDRAFLAGSMYIASEKLLSLPTPLQSATTAPCHGIVRMQAFYMTHLNLYFAFHIRQPSEQLARRILDEHQILAVE